MVTVLPAIRRVKRSRHPPADDAEAVDRLMHKSFRIADVRRADQLAVMGGQEMLHVDAVGANHVPRAVEHKRERRRRGQIVLSATAEEGERK
jgi:hypothetical protein